MPAQRQLEQALAASEAHQASAATAAALAASELATMISAAVRRLRDLLEAIAAERRAAPGVTAQGYRLDTMQAALAEAESRLGAAADALQSERLDEAQAQLDRAAAELDRAVGSGSGAPALHTANQQRITAIEARGKAAAERIAEGRRAFDLVDEFAESSWSDISGNGSEAQAAADRAGEHWERARQANTMEAQGFYLAHQQLDAADQQLDYVEQLIEAIVSRLRDLEQARDASRSLLAEADRSLKEALAFVRANDADVGQQPEQQLREASEQLAAAQAEASQARPDWLRLAAAATAADRLADTALAGARSEAETMQKLRQQVEQLRPIVNAEVGKIAKYVNLHGDDIDAETTTAVREFVQRFEQAQTLDGRIAELAEDQRRAVLEQALAAYTQLQAASATVYKAAFDDVQRLEKLRGELNTALNEARSQFERAEALAAEAGGKTPAEARTLINQARARFERIKLPINGEELLNQTLKEAHTITREAREAAEKIESKLNRRPGGGLGPIIVMSGGHNHGGWGGSSGWSSGGSGPSWGSMGGGGGSFGGGGGGGSFGSGGGGGKW